MSVGGVTVCKICCADLDRSVAFYARLGVQPLGAPSVSEGPDVPRLYGVAARRLRSLRSLRLARPGDPKAPQGGPA